MECRRLETASKQVSKLLQNFRVMSNSAMIITRSVNKKQNAQNIFFIASSSDRKRGEKVHDPNNV